MEGMGGMIKVKRLLLVKLFVFSIVMLVAGQAYALSISPGFELYNGAGTSNSQSYIDSFLQATFEPDLVELYKNDFGTGETGTLQGSYNTAYTALDADGEPHGALIEYTGGPIATDVYLLVKDGANDPFWYLFDLTSSGLNWDGTEALILSGFWPNGGAISHVTLYGNVAPVPEPATMLLLGTGLIGLASVGRKKLKS